MTVDTTPGIKKLTLEASDKHRLVKLALEAEIAKKRANLAHAEWQMASAASEAAGDAIRAKLRVPTEAQDVTINLNDGVITFRMPGIPPGDEE